MCSGSRVTRCSDYFRDNSDIQALSYIGIYYLPIPSPDLSQLLFDYPNGSLLYVFLSGLFLLCISFLYEKGRKWIIPQCIQLIAFKRGMDYVV